MSRRRSRRKGACPPRPPRISAAKLEDIPHQDFRRAVVPGRCAGCGGRADHAHHVVYRSVLEKRGLPEWDTRNAMGLCIQCHFRHHKRFKVLPSTLVTEAHIEHALEMLGNYAWDYLRRRYDVTDDPRFQRREEAA